jgi:hypothetical protein
MSRHLDRSLRRLARSLPLVFACLACLPAVAADQDFDGALQSYRSGRLSDAYGRFLALARKGDPDAARIILFMGQYGGMLHNAMWELTEDEAARLRKTALRPSLRPMPPPPAGYDGFDPKSAPLARDTLASK